MHAFTRGFFMCVAVVNRWSINREDRTSNRLAQTIAIVLIHIAFAY